MREAAARAPLDAELLQATFHELALLLGAKLVDGAAETAHLGAAPPASSSRRRGRRARATLLELPRSPPPFDGGAAPPEPLSSRAPRRPRSRRRAPRVEWRRRR